MGERRLAREIAFQSLYESVQAGTPLAHALGANAERRDASEATRAYARRLVDAWSEHRQAIRDVLEAAVQHWSYERVGLVERCVLEIATAELMACDDVPLSVILDEAVTIARTFSTDESGGFVNGVLDEVATRLHRPGGRAPAAKEARGREPEA